MYLNLYFDCYVFVAMSMSLAENQGANGEDDLSYEALSQLEDVKVPASEDKIAKLPRDVITSAAQAAREGKCSVCRLEYEKGDTLMTLPCGHKFHEDCVTQWLQNYSKKCPYCKEDV